MPAHGLLEARQAFGVTTETSYFISGTGTATVELTTVFPATFTIYPLTTVFTPPPSCLGPSFTVPAGNPSTALLDAENLNDYDLYYSSSGTASIYRAFRSECYPQHYPENTILIETTTGTSGAVGFSPSFAYASNTIFSPGICPSGYQTPATNVVGATTFATCCPSGYAAGEDYDCYATGATITVANGTSTASRAVDYIWASSIAIAYQSSDVARLSSITATAITTTGPGTSSPTPTGPTSTSTHSSGGLSTGAQAGIGVGVSLGVLAIAGVIGVLLLMRRKKRRSSPPVYAGVNQGQERAPMREVDQNAGGY